MEATTIAELLAPFVGDEAPSAHQLQQICGYLELLMKWNARTNLTAVRDEKNIVLRHFGESLFAAKTILPDSRQPMTAIDLGSGAGFPGVPLKIYRPAVQLTLIESQNKKATFLKEVARALRLEGVSVFNGRGENFPGRADLVTLRAVEHFEQVLPIAAGLLETGASTAGASFAAEDSASFEQGRVADERAPIATLGLLIGEAQVKQARELLPDLSWQEPVPLPLSSARCVLVGHR